MSREGPPRLEGAAPKQEQPADGHHASGCDGKGIRIEQPDRVSGALPHRL